MTCLRADLLNQIYDPKSNHAIDNADNFSGVDKAPDIRGVEEETN